MGQKKSQGFITPGCREVHNRETCQSLTAAGLLSCEVDEGFVSCCAAAGLASAFAAGLGSWAGAGAADPEGAGATGCCASDLLSPAAGATGAILRSTGGGVARSDDALSGFDSP